MSVPAFAQYMSTPPPPDRSAPAPAQPPGAVRSDSLTITAKNGQSDQQQWADRYECHKWAKDQSGFDPTLRPPTELSGEEINSRRDQYRRAFTACLEGRGYTVQYGHPASPAVAPAAAAAPVTASHWVRSTPELGYHPIQGQISGGYTATVGKADHELDDGSNVGFGLAFFPIPALPVGIRVDGSYSSFRARDRFLAQFGPNVYHGWDDVYGGDVDLQLDLAHSSSRSKLYLVGGAGWYRERATLREVVFAVRHVLRLLPLRDRNLSLQSDRSRDHLVAQLVECRTRLGNCVCRRRLVFCRGALSADRPVARQGAARADQRGTEVLMMREDGGIDIDAVPQVGEPQILVG